MIINEHVLGGQGAGNGHHGYCIHCGVPLVTDLGYYSWEGVKCVDRDRLKNLFDFPSIVKSYAEFNGLKYNADKNIFIKPYDGGEYSPQQIVDIIKEIKPDEILD